MAFVITLAVVIVGAIYILNLPTGGANKFWLFYGLFIVAVILYILIDELIWGIMGLLYPTDYAALEQAAIEFDRKYKEKMDNIICPKCKCRGADEDTRKRVISRKRKTGSTGYDYGDWEADFITYKVENFFECRNCGHEFNKTYTTKSDVVDV